MHSFQALLLYSCLACAVINVQADVIHVPAGKRGHIRPKVQTDEISYTIDGVKHQGYLTHDDESDGKRPGILVVHEFWGVDGGGGHAKSRAEMLAEEGFTALALDMYGDGRLATHPKDATAFMDETFADMSAAEKRFDEAYDILNNSDYTQQGNISAIGYCFGGAVVLHMARVGKDLDGVVSFHGALNSMLGDKSANIKAKVRSFTGQNDPLIPVEQVTNFTAEMFDAGADFNLQVYPGVLHGFTNPDSTKAGSEFELPFAYDKYADENSWRQTMAFFGSIYES